MYRTWTGRIWCWSAENSKCNIYIAFAGSALPSAAGSTDVWVRLVMSTLREVADLAFPTLHLVPASWVGASPPGRASSPCPTSTTTLRLPTRAEILALNTTVLSSPKLLHFDSVIWPPPLPRPLPFFICRFRIRIYLYACDAGSCFNHFRCSSCRAAVPFSKRKKYRESDIGRATAIAGTLMVGSDAMLGC